MMERQNNQETEECYLPREIIFEILIRLPLKSVPRCKCVCKLWCEIADEHKFIMDHFRRSNMAYEYRDANTPDEFEWWTVLGGLVVEKSSLTNKYRVRNPATHKVLDLDILHDHTLIGHITIFYIPSITSYKLVYVHGKNGGMEYNINGGCQVLTVGTDLTWRTLDIPGLYDLRCERGWSYFTKIYGVFFVTKLFDDELYRPPEIVCLEMGCEHFVNFKIPQALFSSWKKVKPFRWDENLALANLVEQELHVWVLEDYKKQQWAESKRVIDLSLIMNKLPDLKINNSSFSITNNWLSIFPWPSGTHPLLNYHIESKRLEIIDYLPQGKSLKGCYKPSLVNLEGMQPEESSQSRRRRKFPFWYRLALCALCRHDE